MFPISKFLEKTKVKEMKISMQNVHFQSMIKDYERKIESLISEIKDREHNGKNFTGIFVKDSNV